MLLACHKKSYLIRVEFSNFRNITYYIMYCWRTSGSRTQIKTRILQSRSKDFRNFSRCFHEIAFKIDWSKKFITFLNLNLESGFHSLCNDGSVWHFVRNLKEFLLTIRRIFWFFESFNPFVLFFNWRLTAQLLRSEHGARKFLTSVSKLGHQLMSTRIKTFQFKIYYMKSKIYWQNCRLKI